MAPSKKADVTVSWQRLFTEMMIIICVVKVPQKTLCQVPTVCRALLTGWSWWGQEIRVNYFKFQWNPREPIYFRTSVLSWLFFFFCRAAQQKLRSVERTKFNFPLSFTTETSQGKITVSECPTVTMLSKLFSLRSHFMFVILAPWMALGENHITNTSISGTDAVLQEAIFQVEK